MAYELLVLDVDGTLVNTKKEIVGFNGGAINPSITTFLPTNPVVLGDICNPHELAPLYNSSKEMVVIVSHHA